MTKFRQHIIPILLTTLIVIGGVEVLVWQLQKYLKVKSQTIRKEITTNQVTIETQTTPAPSVAKTTAQLKKVITERQLFGVPLTVTSKQQELDLPAITANDLQVLLMGTIGSSSDGSRAIIMDKTDKTQAIYRKGDSVQGIRIKEILRQRVILAIDGQDKILEMNESITYTPQTQAVKPAKREVPKARKTRGVTN